MLCMVALNAEEVEIYSKDSKGTGICPFPLRDYSVGLDEKSDDYKRLSAEYENRLQDIFEQIESKVVKPSGYDNIKEDMEYGDTFFYENICDDMNCNKSEKITARTHQSIMAALHTFGDSVNIFFDESLPLRQYGNDSKKITIGEKTVCNDNVCITEGYINDDIGRWPLYTASCVDGKYDGEQTFSKALQDDLINYNGDYSATLNYDYGKLSGYQNSEYNYIFPSHHIGGYISFNILDDKINGSFEYGDYDGRVVSAGGGYGYVTNIEFIDGVPRMLVSEYSANSLGDHSYYDYLRFDDKYRLHGKTLSSRQVENTNSYPEYFDVTISVYDKGKMVSSTTYNNDNNVCNVYGKVINVYDTLSSIDRCERSLKQNFLKSMGGN